MKKCPPFSDKLHTTTSTVDKNKYTQRHLEEKKTTTKTSQKDKCLTTNHITQVCAIKIKRKSSIFNNNYVPPP